MVVNRRCATMPLRNPRPGNGRLPATLPSLRACGRPDKLRGCDDGDPAKRVQVEQIGIAREARGLAGYAEVQELVVSHVAARHDPGVFAGTVFWMNC